MKQNCKHNTSFVPSHPWNADASSILYAARCCMSTYHQYVFSPLSVLQGVANRDIKLENTLLDSTTRPLIKICDFGYSKVEPCPCSIAHTAVCACLLEAEQQLCICTSKTCTMVQPIQCRLRTISPLTYTISAVLDSHMSQGLLSVHLFDLSPALSTAIQACPL